jgi:putative glutamine amidotransferase
MYFQHCTNKRRPSCTASEPNFNEGEIMIALTHRGTGTDIVAGIVSELGGKLQTVSDKHTAYTARMDRLLLLGGADVSPFFYGEPIIDAQPPDRDRDVVEWILVRRAITERVPILGICRGHQMLAVAHGGTLWQDIVNGPGAYEHGTYHKLNQVHSKLAGRLPTRTVNSLHHQAVRVVPFGFDVAARSPDGIIESVYRPGALGVQWHPELLYPRDRKWLGLFQWWWDGLK